MSKKRGRGRENIKKRGKRRYCKRNLTFYTMWPKLLSSFKFANNKILDMLVISVLIRLLSTFQYQRVMREWG